MGAKPLFAPPNNQTRIFLFCLFKRNKHERKQKQRQQYKENRVHFYILNERCVNFVENRRELFKIFCLKVNLPKIFAPPTFVTQIFVPPIFVTQIFAPNIYDKSTPMLLR